MKRIFGIFVFASLLAVSCQKEMDNQNAAGAGNEKHAFINHATGEFCSEEAKAAIKAAMASYTGSSTLEDIYNESPDKQK